jgi:hypothetical protein
MVKSRNIDVDMCQIIASNPHEISLYRATGLADLETKR